MWWPLLDLWQRNFLLFDLELARWVHLLDGVDRDVIEILLIVAYTRQVSERWAYIKGIHVLALRTQTPL